MASQIVPNHIAAQVIEGTLEVVRNGASVSDKKYFVSVRDYLHRTHWHTPASKIGDIQIRVGGPHGICLLVSGVSLAEGKPNSICPSALAGQLTMVNGGKVKLIFTMAEHSFAAEYEVGAWSQESGFATLPVEFFVPNPGCELLRVQAFGTTNVNTGLVRACASPWERISSTPTRPSTDREHQPHGTTESPIRPQPASGRPGPASRANSEASSSSHISRVAAERQPGTAANRERHLRTPPRVESIRRPLSPGSPERMRCEDSESSTFLMSSPVQASAGRERFDTASDDSGGPAPHGVPSVNLITESSYCSDSDWATSSNASIVGHSRSYSPAPLASYEPLETRTAPPDWRTDLFYQPGFRFGALPDEDLVAIRDVPPNLTDIEREIIAMALGGARASKEVHEILAHAPPNWTRQLDDCLQDSYGQAPTIGDFTCGPCDRQTGEYLVEVVHAPNVEYPGEGLSTCQIELCAGDKRRVWADAATGYLLMVPCSLANTFPAAFAEARFYFDALPGKRAPARDVYLAADDPQTAFDAAEIGVVFNYSDRVPPFVKVGDRAYKLQTYLEGRLKRFLAATSNGSANLGALAEYLIHQHNVEQVDGFPSPTLQFTGRIDDRIWRPVQDPVEAYVDNEWKAAVFVGWAATLYKYIVHLEGSYVSVSSIRQPSED